MDLKDAHRIFCSVMVWANLLKSFVLGEDEQLHI